MIFINNYNVIKSDLVFKGKVIDIFHDTITLPNGKEALREVAVHRGASAIVPVDSNGNIILVRQYRHPIKKEVLEIPAGVLEKGEDFKTAALRELEEEIGYKAKDAVFLTSLNTSLGFCDEVIYIYLADNLEKSVQNLDEEEFITVEKFSLQTVLDMIMSGKITDAKTIAGILIYNQILNNK